MTNHEFMHKYIPCLLNKCVDKQNSCLAIYFTSVRQFILEGLNDPKTELNKSIILLKSDYGEMSSKVLLHPLHQMYQIVRYLGISRTSKFCIAY